MEKSLVHAIRADAMERLAYDRHPVCHQIDDLIPVPRENEIWRRELFAEGNYMERKAVWERTYRAR